MSARRRGDTPTFVLALALAFVLALALAFSVVSPTGAGAQTIRDHRTQPIVRDHRARLCRAPYSPHPSTPSYPWTAALCSLPTNNTQTVGSFCTCSVLVEGHYVTAGGKIVLASAPNG